MPARAIKQRLQDNGDTAKAALPGVTFADSTAGACFRGLALASHFQPVFSLAHQRAVGYQGLLRCTDRNHAPLPPLEAFARCRNENDAVTMDQLCRELHLRNFAARSLDEAWLFLNVNPRVIRKSESHDVFFGHLLDQLSFPAGRIVVVISGSAGPDEQNLKSWVDHYRGLGCLIALNDFAAGHTNFDRIWRLRPDIVKLDRSLIAQAAVNPGARAMLPRIVSMLHETGALVLLQGIESGREAMIAMDTDADLVQGHYFCRPGPTLASPHQQPGTFSRLFEQFRDLATKRQARQRIDSHHYQQGLHHAVAQLRMGGSLQDACAEFLSLPGVRRCFLLDADGRQIGENILSPQEQSKCDPRFVPLRDATGANWLRQHYFRRAIAEHGKVHVTRPYLSITDASPCITFSVALPLDGKLRVLCADLTAEGLMRDAAEKPAEEPAEKPSGEAPELEAHDLRGRAEQMLRAAGVAYAKTLAKTQIAKAQIEMMARVQAEQQAIAEKRARAAAEGRAKVPDPVAVDRAQPLQLVARRAADAILFRKPKRPLSLAEYLDRRNIEARSVPIAS